MKKKRIFLILILLFAVGGFLAYNYVYQDHRDIKSETSQLEISAPYLLERFKTNNGDDLLNKTITVTGTISSMEEGAITLNESVYAQFLEPDLELKEADNVVLKGRCIGYDELFEIVKLDQCTLIK
ncbi:OB-fold protein [Marixanthomonas spongiae]|uniref:Uncharacterized protein n=1 Tax=Marixanthomonas spongiae TaxID=2174845 RepID=A0A2U0I5U8_9FLAO|nr:hypothetical protein [Marixanthomonas spongiae]PVW16483.1 hypothetical protein DDV96_04305 [Marixanthomonas spongiae]